MRDYSITNITVASITISPLKVRRAKDAADITELAASFDEVGFIQPIVVRSTGDGKYELLVGEHRLDAAREAKFRAVPAIVFSGSDEEAALMSVESDLRTYAPTAEERDLLIARYEESYEAKHGRPKVGRPSKTAARRESFAKVAAAAARKNPSTIYRSLARRKLTHTVQDALRTRKISPSHADELAKLTSEQQDAIVGQLTDKTRSQAREIVRTVLARSTSTGSETTGDSSPSGHVKDSAEEQLEIALASLRAHQNSFAAQLEPTIEEIRRAGTLINTDDIERPDRVLVELLTVIHRMGDVLTQAGHAVQRVRSELRRQVRVPRPVPQQDPPGRNDDKA